MGNYVSCTLPTPLIKNAKTARVVFPGGEVRQFREQVKAAEMMLDCPNHFLTNSQSLHIGRRFSALSADEELEFGNVYIMFPMKKVNSVISAPDMALLFLAANSAAKRISGVNKIRVLPDFQESEKQESGDENENGNGNGGSKSRLGLEEIEGIPVEEFKHRLSMCRSRKPMLETIKEEPFGLLVS